MKFNKKSFSINLIFIFENKQLKLTKRRKFFAQNFDVSKYLFRISREITIKKIIYSYFIKSKSIITQLINFIVQTIINVNQTIINVNIKTIYQHIKNLINKKQLSFSNFLILLFVNFNYSFIIFKFNLKKLKFFDSIYKKKIITKKKH